MHTGLMDRYLPAGAQHYDLLREYHQTTLGVLHHPGESAWQDGHVRWGTLADGRPWLTSNLREAMGDWIFRDPADVSRAIAAIMALRPDGRWERQSATPEGLGRPRES